MNRNNAQNLKFSKYDTFTNGYHIKNVVFKVKNKKIRNELQI